MDLTKQVAETVAEVWLQNVLPPLIEVGQMSLMDLHTKYHMTLQPWPHDSEYYHILDGLFRGQIDTIQCCYSKPYIPACRRLLALAALFHRHSGVGRLATYCEGSRHERLRVRAAEVIRFHMSIDDYGYLKHLPKPPTLLDAIGGKPSEWVPGPLGHVGERGLSPSERLHFTIASVRPPPPQA